MPRILILLALAAAAAHGASTIAAGGGGFGVASGGEPAPGGAAAQGPLNLQDRDYETWVDRARVGDFVVRKFVDGRLVRSEVTAIEEKRIAVREETTSAAGVAPTTALFGYRRAKEPGDHPQEMDLVPGRTGTTEIAGRKVAYRIVDGWRIIASMGLGERLVHVKLTKLQQAIARDVPFGGVIREAVAPPDGESSSWAFDGRSDKLVKHYNRIEKPEPSFEVVGFGRGVDLAAKDHAPER